MVTGSFESKKVRSVILNDKFKELKKNVSK